MKYLIKDEKYSFTSAFDTSTGAYIRTGIIDPMGIDTGVDPFMASYPVYSSYISLEPEIELEIASSTNATALALSRSFSAMKILCALL